MPALESVVGPTISHYRLVTRIGAGGMGVVYQAEDTQLNRFVALKLLPEDVANDSRPSNVSVAKPVPPPR